MVIHALLILVSAARAAGDVEFKGGLAPGAPIIPSRRKRRRSPRFDAANLPLSERIPNVVGGAATIDLHAQPSAAAAQIPAAAPQNAFRAPAQYSRARAFGRFAGRPAGPNPDGAAGRHRSKGR